MDRQLPEQPTAVLDARELMARCMGNLEFAQRILAKFQDRFDQDLAELEQALLAEDGAQIQSIAHRIKGASANVAAHGLRRLAGGIEELAHQRSISEIPSRLEDLRSEQFRLANSATLLGPPEAFAG